MFAAPATRGLFSCLALVVLIDYPVLVSSKSVNSGLRWVFDEFMNSPDPYDLRPTIASLETLAVELRDSIEQNNNQKRHDFYQRLSVALAKVVARHPVLEELGLEKSDLVNFAKELAEQFYEAVRTNYEIVFGSNLHISPEQAKVMATIVEAKGKMVERYKKLAENTTVSLVYDEQLVSFIIQFLQLVIIPNVSSMKDRAAIAVAAKQFLPQVVRNEG